MKKIELKIGGMHCESCSVLIEDELNDMDGIVTYKVETGHAVVEFDENKTSEATIRKAITGLGYKVM